MRDYIKKAIRTKPERYDHLESFPVESLVALLEQFAETGKQLDEVKKTVIYGKEFTGKVPAPTKDYPHAAIRHVDPDLFHSILGLVTEAGELADALLHAVRDGYQIDKVNLSEEFGDSMWYMAVGLDTMGKTFTECGNQNVAKLKQRFPDKFTTVSALRRDLVAERRILEEND